MNDNGDQTAFVVESERRKRTNINFTEIVVIFGALQILLFIVFFIITIEITKRYDYSDTDTPAFEKNFTQTSKGQTPLKTIYDSNAVSNKIDTVIKLMGWYRARNNYYYKLFPLKVSYFTATNKCKNFGASLASIGLRNATVRNEIITKLVKPTKVDTWIGLDDFEVEGRWVWSDGVSSNKSNTNWRPGQPDDFRGKEDCGHLAREYQWTVNDHECRMLFYFLCEAK